LHVKLFLAAAAAVLCGSAQASGSVFIDLPSTLMSTDASQCYGGCLDTGAGQYYAAAAFGASTTVIYTRPETLERVKLTTASGGMGLGDYSWRVYLPPSPADDAISTGMFLYSDSNPDDRHELDFECGYGKAVDRSNNGANGGGEVLCFMTSQGLPWAQQITTLATGAWHTFKLSLSLAPTGNYRALWSIDNTRVFAKFLGYGPGVTFKPYISVEHLPFMGDRLPPAHGYEAYFDSFQYLAR
jgi:hypothetical protein